MPIFRKNSQRHHDSALIVKSNGEDDSCTFSVSAAGAVRSNKGAQRQKRKRTVRFDLNATLEYHPAPPARGEADESTWYTRADLQQFQRSLVELSKQMAASSTTVADYATALQDAHRACRCIGRNDDGDMEEELQQLTDTLVHEMQRLPSVEHWGLHTEWTTPKLVRDRTFRRQQVRATLLSKRNAAPERLPKITRPAQLFAAVQARAMAQASIVDR